MKMESADRKKKTFIWNIAEIAEFFGNLKDYSYKVWEYSISLRRLLIEACPMTEAQESKEKVHIAFNAVDFMVLRPYWDKANLQLATPEMCLKVLSDAGIERNDDDRIPYLVYAKNDKLSIQIIAGSVHIYIGNLPIDWW